MLRSFAFILIAALIAQLLGPWWAFAPVCAAAGIMFPTGALSSFAAGFLAIPVLWTGAALQAALAVPTGFPMRMSELLGLGGPAALASLMALLAGLIGGLASLGGGSLRHYLFPSRPENR